MTMAMVRGAPRHLGGGYDPINLRKKKQACLPEQPRLRSLGEIRDQRIRKENDRTSYISNSIYTWFSKNNAKLQFVTTSGHVKLLDASQLINAKTAGLHIESCSLSGTANTGAGNVTVKKCKKIGTVIFAGEKAILQNSDIKKFAVLPRAGSKQKQVVKISNCTIDVIEFVNCKRFCVSISGDKPAIDFKHTSSDGLLTLVLKNVQLGQMIHTEAT